MVWADSDTEIGEGTVRQGMAVPTVYGDEPATEATRRCECRGFRCSPAGRRAGTPDGGETVSLAPVATRNMLPDQPLADNELEYQNDAVLEVEAAQRPNVFALASKYSKPGAPGDDDPARSPRADTDPVGGVRRTRLSNGLANLPLARPSVFSTCRTALRRRGGLRNFPQRPLSEYRCRACSATSFFRRAFSF